MWRSPFPTHPRVAGGSQPFYVAEVQRKIAGTAGGVVPDGAPLVHSVFKGI
jgi:hypothetical protein